MLFIILLSCWVGPNDKINTQNDTDTAIQTDTDSPPSDMDEDGDGQSVEDGDCDDTNPEINGSAIEVCDLTDNNCNGEVDEGVLILYYLDSDGDGYGVEQSTVESCTLPSGYASTAEDCDDDNNTIFPGAEELCDGHYNNCILGSQDINDLPVEESDQDNDGFVICPNIEPEWNPMDSTIIGGGDCNDLDSEINPNAVDNCDSVDNNCSGDESDAINKPTFYNDADGDGYGDNSNSIESCEQPSSYVIDNTDCNDNNSLINPDLSEICDGLDNDCINGIDDGLNFDDYYIDADADGYGDTLATPVNICEQPSGYVLDNTDCDDLNPQIYPAANEVCDGYFNNCIASSQSSFSLPQNEIDADNDGYVTCEPMDILNWGNVNGSIIGGDDCADNDPMIFPGQTEVCDGVDNNCNTLTDEGIPTTDYFSDTDSDGYGDPTTLFSSCYQPSNMVTNATDCDDTNPSVFPNAVELCDGYFNDCSNGNWAPLSLPLAEANVDGDGYVYCELDIPPQDWGSGIINGGGDCDDNDPDSTFSLIDADCDFLTYDFDCDDTSSSDLNICLDVSTIPIKLIRIESGTSPRGDYELTNDFYVMESEVTFQIYDAIMDNQPYSTSTKPKNQLSWIDAIEAANSLSALYNIPACYDSTDVLGQYSPLFGSNIYMCDGFRLLSEAEWEYAALSNVNEDFWTGVAPNYGGSNTNNSSCDLNATISDGASSQVADYAWFCGNTFGNGSQDVKGKDPNGFGLYDMHGNVWEWTHDRWCTFPNTYTNPDCQTQGSNTYRTNRGGSYVEYSAGVSTKRSNRNSSSESLSFSQVGFRLGIKAPPSAP